MTHYFCFRDTSVKTLLSLLLFCTLLPLANAGVISNGVLQVTIIDDNGLGQANGAIGQVLFGGADFFNHGTAISDFGMEGNPGSFVLNDTYGRTDQAVTQSGNTYSGIFGGQLEFHRSYSLVSGLNVLRITTSFTNLGPDLTLSYFDTFDPDQGADFVNDFRTYNDVFGLAGGRVGQARIDLGGFTHTVVIGSTDTRAIVASGTPQQIADSFDLSQFLISPFDGDDNLADEGTHIGFRSLIKQGESTSFTFDMAFGLTPSEAQNAFISANVPEPSTFATFALLGMSVFAMRIRRNVV